MFCNKCGSENRNDRKFCANCGAPLKDYRKPAEDLIMPDMEKKQKIVAKCNKVRLATNIVMTIFLVCAAVFAFCSFYINKKLVWWFIGISFACLLALLITYIIKRKLVGKMLKKIKEN